MKKIYLLVFWAVSSLVGCESLEDTYSDYIGDGPVRYVGKCEGVQVLAGWNRLTVKWKNSLDPNVVNNRVTCTADEFAFDTIVPAAADSCDIFGLADATYNIMVEALDADGKVSLSEPVTGRPYTDAHEAVKSFPRGIMKNFFLSNQVLLMLSEWDESFADFTVKYTDETGTSKCVELTRMEFERKRVLLTDVDVTEPICVLRKGFLEGCGDTITMAPYELVDEPVLRPDFKAALNERYGMTDFSKEALDKVTELELDYDLNSLEDVLYFTHLKKLYLGKNRFIDSELFYGWYMLPYEEIDNSLYCLNLAVEQSELDIVHYGNLYFWKWDDIDGDNCMTHEDWASWPEELKLLDTDNWEVAFSVEHQSGFDASRLFDDSPSTFWYSDSPVRRNVEITIDMQETQIVDGLKINQVGGLGPEANYPVTSLGVKVSADGNTWEMPTYVNNCTLGATEYETALIRFKQSYTVRYIRLTATDGSNWQGTVFGVAVGDIIPYREN